MPSTSVEGLLYLLAIYRMKKMLIAMMNWAM
jgi:hypothetical protein